MSYGAQKLNEKRTLRALKTAMARKKKEAPRLLEHAIREIKKLKSEIRRLKKALKYSDQKRQEYLAALPSED